MGIEWELCVMEGYSDFKTMLLDLKKQGLSDEDIAEKIGVSIASLRKKRKALGIATCRQLREESAWIL